MSDLVDSKTFWGSSMSSRKNREPRMEPLRDFVSFILRYFMVKYSRQLVVCGQTVIDL